MFWGGRATGVLLSATGGYLVTDASDRQRRHEADIERVTYSAAVALENQRRAGIVVLGLGVGAILTGVFFDSLQPVEVSGEGPTPEPATAFGISAGPSGAYAQLAVRF